MLVKERARTLRQRSLGALAHERADSWGAVARAALQVPSERAAPGLAVSHRHHALLPSLRQARPHLCGPCPRLPPREAGAGLRCKRCGWNGARDYAAAINIALLGVVFLVQESHHQEHVRRSTHPSMKTKPLTSASYRGAGLALRLPPTSPRGRLLQGGERYVNGWIKSVTLHSALSKDIMLRLSG